MPESASGLPLPHTLRIGGYSRSGLLGVFGHFFGNGREIEISPDRFRLTAIGTAG